MVMKIQPNDKGWPLGKLADAELRLFDGPQRSPHGSPSLASCGGRGFRILG